MDELEKKAIAIAKQYGFVLRMNRPITELLREVADRLDWKEFKTFL